VISGNFAENSNDKTGTVAAEGVNAIIDPPRA